MQLLEPSLGLLDRTDSGLDVDALRIVDEGNHLRDPKRSFVMVTHYQRLLDHVKPDFVHVLAGGQIRASGDFTLANAWRREAAEAYWQKHERTRKPTSTGWQLASATAGWGSVN